MFRDLERNTYFQKLYPTVNNEDLLEFRIPGNTKANICLSTVLLRFVVQVPQIDNAEVLYPDNFIGHKQFSSVEVRINGDAVSRRNCSNEYFLSAYFQYLINFSSDYLTTSCSSIGVIDNYAVGEAELSQDSPLSTNIKLLRQGINDDFKYEIVMPIDASIFTSNQALPTNTPVEISFERAQTKVSTVLIESCVTTTVPNVLDLEDAYIIVPYKIDEDMHNMEKTAAERPIQLKYDDYSINRFNISKDSPNVRLANVLTGQMPTKIFYGIMDLSAYTGDFNKPSTCFSRKGVKKATLYVDGNVLSGYPISVDESSVSIPYIRLQENINRYMNCYSSRVISQRDFKNYYFIYSAVLDPTSSGSLTFEFDFEKEPEGDFILITCCVFEKTLEIDSFRNFKIL